LQLWLAADDQTTLYDATSGGSLVAADGSVARWEDKSGNGRHATQATSGSRPLRKTAQLNGMGGLSFDGSNDTLMVNAMASFFSGENPSFTVIGVAKTNATGSTQDFFSAALSSSDIENTRCVWNAGSQKLQLARESPSVASTKSTSGATNLGTAAKVAAWVFGGSTGRVYVNGVADSAATDLSHPGPITFNQAAIGSLPRQSPAVFFNGLIFEVIVYNSALSDASRAAAESYLMSKWGIA
jgi:hypothetical protein